MGCTPPKTSLFDRSIAESFERESSQSSRGHRFRSGCAELRKRRSRPGFEPFPLCAREPAFLRRGNWHGHVSKPPPHGALRFQTVHLSYGHACGWPSPGRPGARGAARCPPRAGGRGCGLAAPRGAGGRGARGGAGAGLGGVRRRLRRGGGWWVWWRGRWRGRAAGGVGFVGWPSPQAHAGSRSQYTARFPTERFKEDGMMLKKANRIPPNYSAPSLQSMQGTTCSFA